MSGAFVYVGAARIKPGKLEEARKNLAELVDFVETNEPRMIAFHLFLDEEGNTLTTVHIHPDSASMEFHLQVAAKHFATAFDFLESNVSEQYLGAMSDGLALTKAFTQIKDAKLRRRIVGLVEEIAGEE